MAQQDTSSLEEKFDAAVRVIRSLPEDGPYQPSDNMMLMFYSYYKQATLGPCNIPRPTGFWDSRGKAKWDSWSSLGDMTKEEAMMNYVDDIQLILETIPVSAEVSDLVETLGNFYAEVNGGRDDEENEVDARAFTRPFAQKADELIKLFVKPRMEGYGDLWDDIQDGRESDSLGAAVSGEDGEQNGENSERVRKRESSDSEADDEEESCDEGDNTDDGEDEEETDGDVEKGSEKKASQISRDTKQDKLPESIEEINGRSRNSSDTLGDASCSERTSPGPRLLRAEEGKRRPDARGSVSSAEPSVSSVANGTHSSLNSEVEEEELACSAEPCAERHSYLHLNGRLGDHNIIPDNNHRATDSDNEEFCDSMEHLAMEEGSGLSKAHCSGSRATSVRRNELWSQTKATSNGGETVAPFLDVGFGPASSSRTGRVSQPSRIPCGSQLCFSVEAACCCATQSRRSRAAVRDSVHEQIAAALLRLQDDMADVLHRLHTLEVLTVSQSSSPSPRQEEVLPLVRKIQRLSWWPFSVSPVTAFFVTVWPLIAHWLIQLYLLRKRRKIS